MLSYNQICEEIETEGRRIGQLAEEIADCAANAAESEADYKLEVAKSRIKFRDVCAANGTKVTVGEIDDVATLESAESHRAFLLARESLTAVREALRAAQSRMEGLRSLAAGYRQAGG